MLDKSSPSTTPVQVECGWSFTSILTQSADVLVYWPTTGGIRRAISEKRHEWETRNISEARAVSIIEGEIPCYTWTLETIHPVQLPGIPIERLPNLIKTGLTSEQAKQETKLIQIAALDNHLIGLTNKGHVLRYSSLYGEDSYMRGQWDYVRNIFPLSCSTLILAFPQLATLLQRDRQS